MDTKQKEKLKKFSSLLGSIDYDKLGEPVTTATQTQPLPSTSGGQATPSGIGDSYNPNQRISRGSSAGGSVQGYEIYNQAEHDKAVADQAAANEAAATYNNRLPGMMAKINSSIKPNMPTHDLFGNRIPDQYVPILPLPAMPEKIDIPELKHASVGESWQRSEREASPTPKDKPKYFLKNTKLKVDGGTGTLGVETVDTPNYSQDSGIDTLSKKSNLQNVRVLDNYFNQGRPRAFDKNTTWNVESRASDSNKSRGKVGMKGDMFDALTRHAGNSIMKLAPDLLDMSKVTKDKDGTYNFAGRSLPLKKEKAYDIIDGNGKRIPFDKGTWDKVKDKPGYDVVSNIRYDQLLNDIVAQFQASNGMPNTGRYDKKGALYTTYDQATKDAMNSSDWKAFEEQHLNNQRVSDAAAFKWKLIYGNTL